MPRKVHLAHISLATCWFEPPGLGKTRWTKTAIFASSTRHWARGAEDHKIPVSWYCNFSARHRTESQSHATRRMIRCWMVKSWALPRFNSIKIVACHYYHYYYIRHQDWILHHSMQCAYSKKKTLSIQNRPSPASPGRPVNRKSQ